MLPQQTLSTVELAAQFLSPRDLPYHLLLNYERGGNDLLDSSAGLQTKIWRGQYIGSDVVLDAPGVGPYTIITVPNITEFQFTFDQSMNPFVTYMVNETNGFFYWFDTTLPGFVTTALPVGAIRPRCSLDDKRELQSDISDVILTYVLDGDVYFRAQRDRFLIDYLLASDVDTDDNFNVGMSRGLRFQMGPVPGVPTHTFVFSW